MQNKSIISTWRTTEDKRFEYYESNLPTPCPWCDCHVMLRMGGWLEPSEMDIYYTFIKCMLCGWSWIIVDHNDMWAERASKHIKEYSINDLDVSLKELGSHIKNSPLDIYNLNWARFEDLVNDVFREHGYNTVQTARTRDDGADLLMIGDGSKIIGIVECKKYARNRAVGVEIVRSLVGAAVLWRVSKAYLVTSSRFTTIAKKRAHSFRQAGYELNLLDATEFLKLLGSYNEALPSLNHLSEKTRVEIIENNKEHHRKVKHNSVDALIKLYAPQ